MATRQINVQRFSVTTSKSCKDVVAGLESKIGHPDVRKNISAAQTRFTWKEWKTMAKNIAVQCKPP
jgi:hypothetical protein